MKIRSVYLIGLDVWFTGSSEIPLKASGLRFDAKDLEGLAPPTYVAHGAYLELVGLKGFVWSSRAIFKNHRCVLPDFWSDKVDRIFMARTGNEDYATWRLLIELNPRALDELVELDAFDCARQYDGLFEATSPRCSGIRIHPDFPKYSSILYVEPEENLCGRDSDISCVARDVLSLLGQEGTVTQPHRFLNLLLAQDVGLGVPDYKIAAVGLKPLPEEKRDNVMMVPLDVWKIGSCLAYILQLRHMSERLKELAFYRWTLKEYVRDLERGDGILTSYEGVFLEDREEELTVRPHIQRLAGALRREVVDKYLSLVRGTSASVRVETPVSDEVGPIRYDVLEAIERALQQGYRDIREISESISDRADALASFLRDATTADATQADLSLQVSVRRLTLVTMVVSLVALVAGVLPEESKQHLFDLLSGILHALYDALGLGASVF